MKHKLTAILALSLFAVGLSACSYPQRRALMHPGMYENTSTSTDQHGTTTEQKTSTEVTEDRYGNRKATTKTKTTRDPKGMFNKTTTRETKQSSEERQ